MFIVTCTLRRHFYYVVRPQGLLCTWNWNNCCLETFPQIALCFKQADNESPGTGLPEVPLQIHSLPGHLQEPLRGSTPKHKFTHASQWPTWNAGLSKNSRLRPVILTLSLDRFLKQLKANEHTCTKHIWNRNKQTINQNMRLHKSK